MTNDTDVRFKHDEGESLEDHVLELDRGFKTYCENNRMPYDESEESLYDKLVESGVFKRRGQKDRPCVNPRILQLRVPDIGPEPSERQILDRQREDEAALAGIGPALPERRRPEGPRDNQLGYFDIPLQHSEDRESQRPEKAKNENPGAVPEPPVKRPRGRPRKNQSMNPTPVPEPTEKRPRGRPRKDGQPPKQSKRPIEQGHLMSNVNNWLLRIE